jgi:hypothetical protein
MFSKWHTHQQTIKRQIADYRNTHNRASGEVGQVFLKK